MYDIYVTEKTCNRVILQIALVLFTTSKYVTVVQAPAITTTVAQLYLFEMEQRLYYH